MRNEEVLRKIKATRRLLLPLRKIQLNVLRYNEEERLGEFTAHRM